MHRGKCTIFEGSGLTLQLNFWIIEILLEFIGNGGQTRTAFARISSNNSAEEYMFNGDNHIRITTHMYSILMRVKISTYCRALLAKENNNDEAYILPT